MRFSVNHLIFIIIFKYPVIKHFIPIQVLLVLPNKIDLLLVHLLCWGVQTPSQRLDCHCVQQLQNSRFLPCFPTHRRINICATTD